METEAPRVPSPIKARVTKSNIYEDLLTLKVWDERKGRLASPRQAIMDAGYKEGDEIFLLSRGVLEGMMSGVPITDCRMAKIKDVLFPCQS